MTLISNTGPLMALAKANRLDVVERLFGQVQIPPAVYRELLAGKRPEAIYLDEAFARFIQVGSVPPCPPEVQVATLQLGTGEQQAIALAYQLKAILLIDDHAGRAAARKLGVSILGLVSLLIRAKEVGLIPAVHHLLRRKSSAMRVHGNSPMPS